MVTESLIQSKNYLAMLIMRIQKTNLTVTTQALKSWHPQRATVLSLAIHQNYLKGGRYK